MITNERILMHLDSGNDRQDNFPGDEFANVAFIIQRNLRKEKLSAGLDLAKNCGHKKPWRPGKRNWIGKIDIGIDGRKLPYPIVFDVTERTVFGQIECHGFRWKSAELFSFQFKFRNRRHQQYELLFLQLQNFRCDSAELAGLFFRQRFG